MNVKAHDLAETTAKAKHDLIKHLDIPHPGTALSAAAWEVLLRRLYNKNSGITSLGAIWIFKLKEATAIHPALGPEINDLEAIIRTIGLAEQDAKKAARELLPVPLLLIEQLHELVATVRALDNKAQHHHNLSTPDKLDALEWLLDEHPQTNTSDNTGNQRRRVLVVDDRLDAIERFHAIDHLRERFEWVTLCELEGPCWHCPHSTACPMKRARNFRELEGALRRAQATSKPIDVILMDVRFDDIAAGELLAPPPGLVPDNEASARALQGPLIVRLLHERTDLPRVPVVLMTARETLPPGAERLLQGLDGLHFLDDEASIEALAARLDTVGRRASRPMAEGDFFWGRAPAMLAVREQVELLALGPRPVLLTGPSGTGKSFLVEEVILPLSGRSHLVTLDLSALPETLVESELFGHVKGAFSGAHVDRPGLIEEADGGILFIDEIGHLTPENQRRLLLFLQDRQVRRVGASHRTRRKVDVKVVTATHLDLAHETESGAFRFDLYMRLRPATQVRLPTLAERIEDIDNLIRHLVDRLLTGPELLPYVQEVARTRATTDRVDVIFGHNPAQPGHIGLRFPQATLAAFRNHPWTGNTRELDSVLDTLLLKAFADARLARFRSTILEIDHYLALKLLGVGKGHSPGGVPTLNITITPASDLKEMRQRLERAYLVEAFKNADGDMEQVTELILGSTDPDDRHRLIVRMNQLGLKVSELKNN